MPKQKKLVQNIDYANKVNTIKQPDKITDIDINKDFQSYLMDAAQAESLDISKLQSFTSISRSREDLYQLIDMMAEDPIISAALTIYASDVCEPNKKNQVVWCSSDDPDISRVVDNILDDFNVNQNAYNWVYSLCKYGDLYLRLYRESDFNVFDKYVKDFNKAPEDKQTLNEDIKINLYSKNDRYAHYMEMVKNPAEVFDLVKYGKSYGFIKTISQVATTYTLNDPLYKPSNLQSTNNYRFKTDDVNVFSATEFVHASLTDTSNRTDEEVSLTSGDDELTFNVKRGKSVLYDSFKAWRELSLLENAIMLNRITKSSVVRLVKVNVPDTDGPEVRKILNRVKALFEQKTALKAAQSMAEYVNPGSMENTIYVPVRGDTGSVTIESVGGDATNDQLNDLDYWKNKLYSSLGIPGAFLGEDSKDGGIINNGESLSLKSSRYAKTIRAIQNTFIQALTDAVNLTLLDMGLKDYINKYDLIIERPTTAEQVSRRKTKATEVDSVGRVLDLLRNNGLEDNAKLLDILTIMLPDALDDPGVIDIVNEAIEDLKNGTANTGEEDLGGDLGGGSLGGGDLGGDLGDLGGGDLEGDLGSDLAPEAGEESAEEVPEAPAPAEGETPLENFYNNNGGKPLNEADNLPSFEDLGISYPTVRR